MKKNIANIITFTRIISTIIMAFTNVLSNAFFIAYIYSGFSDVIDGFIARKLKIESDFGRKLDSVSDLFFYATMIIKIWPYLVMYLPQYMWALMWILLGIRLSLYLYFSIGQKKLLANHTYLNKASGLFAFGLPFMLRTSYFLAYSKMVISIAFTGALYDLYLVIKGKSKA